MTDEEKRVKKALKLAIAVLTDRRRRYVQYRHMAELGFEEGKRGVVHLIEHEDAIQVLTDMLEKGRQQ